MAKRRISLAHPIGNPFARHAVLALWEQDLLAEIITAFVYRSNGSLAHLLQRLPLFWRDRLISELERRAWLPDLDLPVTTYPQREIIRILLTRGPIGRWLGLSAQGLADDIYRRIDRQVARHHLHDIQAIYAYEDGAAETFQVAHQRHILCLYDLPIPFYQTCQQIQAEEAAQFPELASALQSIREPAWKIARKQQEVALADHIIVASSMTQRSLLSAGVSSEKISIVPYGAPIDYFHPRSCPTNDSPVLPPVNFRALFVGRVGPRKGVHYLLQVWHDLNLPNAELCLVGINEFPAAWFATQVNALQPEQWRYVPSVPHAKLQQYYQAANVFVFPSLIEGFGLVLLEAMACGVPVITTPNTAGPEIITDGIEGFIVPIRDRAALQEKLTWCAEHPEHLAAMGRAARQRAEQLSWSVYRQQLGEVFQHVLL